MAVDSEGGSRKLRDALRLAATARNGRKQLDPEEIEALQRDLQTLAAAGRGARRRTPPAPECAHNGSLIACPRISCFPAPRALIVHLSGESGTGSRSQLNRRPESCCTLHR